MKFGIIQFLGSNCDADCVHVLQKVLDQEVSYIWHEDKNLGDVDCVILPGGFSYGDYLRTGAMAAHSPIMSAVSEFAEDGGLVLGICNGFQILCEAGLLPGILVRNKKLKFICDNVTLNVERSDTRFTSAYQKNESVQMPIAHMEGHYYIDEIGLAELKKNQQIILSYVENVNGSVANIAGIINKRGNVFGLMPHPERASEKVLGGEEGLKLFQSVIQNG